MVQCEINMDLSQSLHAASHRFLIVYISQLPRHGTIIFYFQFVLSLIMLLNCWGLYWIIFQHIEAEDKGLQYKGKRKNYKSIPHNAVFVAQLVQ